MTTSMEFSWASCERGVGAYTPTHLTSPPKFTLVENMAVDGQEEVGDTSKLQIKPSLGLN